MFHKHKFEQLTKDRKFSESWKNHSMELLSETL